MKKTLILLATAFVALVACNEEIEAPVSKDLVTSITAIAPDAKATVDGFQVQWTTGDQVALFQTSGDPVPFTLEGEGPVTNGTFSTDSPVTAPNGLAAFPAAGASFTSGKISVVIPSEFAYGTSPVPMVGVSTGGTTFNFSLACGAAEIDLKDVPPYPCNLVLTSDKNITGTLEIANYANPSNASLAPEGAGKKITVTGIPKGNARVTIPMPAGMHNISFALVAVGDGTSIVPRSNKTKANLEVISGQICNLKQIDLEEGGRAPIEKGSSGSFNPFSLYGASTWKICTEDGCKGIYVFGGGGAAAGYPAFISPKDKTWCWDSTVGNEYDNELKITISSMSSPFTGTFEWGGGADGKFWNYKWSSTAASFSPFNGTDLSAYYDRLPTGEHSISLDTNTWDVTIDNGEKPHVLVAGTYTCYDRTLTIPDECFALMFHIGNLKPQTSWNTKDIDRFLFCPLEYILVFKKKS